MPRRKATVSPPAAVTDQRSYDEANVSRLGLICIQERIPDSYTSWEVNFVREGRPSRLTCVAPAEYGGVPHGLDGDISTALIDMYIEQGAPPTGQVRTTAYRLLQRAGFSDAGHYYQALKRSLYRLRFAGYSASESWRDAPRERWTTVTFTYLTGLNFEAEDRELNLSGGSDLIVTLAEPIVRSIRASYIKPLDLDFMRSLQRPLTRSLYRLLDAQRYSPTNLTEPLDHYRVTLAAWAQECKVVDKTPDKVKRTLQGAHQELIERGYLRAVHVEGRGRTSVFTYEFAGSAGRSTTGEVQTLDADSEALRALVSEGVSRPVAEQLLRQFGEARVLERQRKARAIQAGGYRPRRPSAFLVDVIKDDHGKYPDPPGYVSAERAAANQVARQRREAQVEGPLEPPAPLGRAEAVEGAIEGLRIFLGRRFTAVQWAALEQYLKHPDVDPMVVTRTFLQRAYSGETESAVAELLASL